MSPADDSGDAARLREFQHFLDGTVHGIRTPLRRIATSASLLSQKWGVDWDEESRDLMSAIQEGVGNLDHLSQLVAEYSMALVVSKSSVSRPLPVANALQIAIANLKPRIQETGADIYAGQLPRLEADHEQLAVLFRCLLSNALDYCGQNVVPRVEITATKAADEWRFAVSDNGVGIAPRFHRQIFEAFERLQGDPHGLGLGLTISQKIVSAHGGRLWVDSREGDGSTFFFTIPAGPTE